MQNRQIHRDPTTFSLVKKDLFHIAIGFQGWSDDKEEKMDRSARDDRLQLETMTPAAGSTASSKRFSQLFPSPLLTPPLPCRSKTNSKASLVGAGSCDDLQEYACRSFENYLVEMIVEEGRVRDLMDVEELLFCWKNLKCPVFIDLVSQFYGELCKDLFVAAESEPGDIATS